jgi:Tat protein secretion system quality control protein TatD with DNase activity
LNFLLGIGGVVTFKNGKIDQFLHEIPLEKIVLETDSPYLRQFHTVENVMKVLIWIWSLEIRQYLQ